MQQGQTRGGEALIQHVAVEVMIELEPRPGMPHESLLPGESGQCCFDIVRGKPGSTCNSRGRKRPPGDTRDFEQGAFGRREALDLWLR